MALNAEMMALDAFRNAATRVPAYGELLREAGINPQQVTSAQDFRRLPELRKQNTFQRFSIERLCLDGVLGRPATVLTSSGHSGVFAFGITDADSRERTVEWIDDALDQLFDVRSRPSLLINCLPMGVKIPTHACTVAETSVRPDMVVGLVQAFARHYSQLIIVGEAAFLKLTLETGKRAGVDWKNHIVHVVLGEEPLAENGRHYLQEILRHDIHRPENGMVLSSMGVAEIGLNLFFEAPPIAPLVLLRRLLHVDPVLRHAILGPSEWVPSLFTYDPRRVFVEFDAAGHLILTTLDLNVPIPLIRYRTGDRGCVLQFNATSRPAISAQGIPFELVQSIPIVAISGRGEHALAGTKAVYPEAVKEGIYHNSKLAALTTANFRLSSGANEALIRIQLSPDTLRSEAVESEFLSAISRYVNAPCRVQCEPYEGFRGGMELDYERKFHYLES